MNRKKRKEKTKGNTKRERQYQPRKEEEERENKTGNLRVCSFVLSDLSGLQKAPHLGLTSPQKDNSEESKGGDTKQKFEPIQLPTDYSRFGRI